MPARYPAHSAQKQPPAHRKAGRHSHALAPQSTHITPPQVIGAALTVFFAVLLGIMFATDQTRNTVVVHTDASRPYATLNGSTLVDKTITPAGLVYLAQPDGTILGPGWVTTSQYDGTSRLYYVNEDRFACVPGFSYQGGFHYTTLTGEASCGGFVVDGARYFADDQGIIATDQWVTTDAFTPGHQSKYWAGQDGRLAAQAGFFTVDGITYYLKEDGSILTGCLPTEHGLIIARSDGVLAENKCSKGWADASSFCKDSGRYFFTSFEGHLYAQTGFFQAELDDQTAWFYANPDTGKVLCGKLQTENGLLVAKDNGVLAESLTEEGWYRGSDFDQLEQRYYFKERAGHLYAQTGFFQHEESTYYGYPDYGFLSRNGMVWDSGTYYASDDQGTLTATDSPYGEADPELSTVSWINNPFYLDFLAQKAQEEDSPTDYVVVADYARCRLVVFQRTDTLTSTSGKEDLDDDNRNSTDHGFISITNIDTETEWTAIKAFNGNFGKKSFAGVHNVVHKREGNVLANAITLDSGEDNPSAYSTCFLESWAGRAPNDIDWQDPETGLWHDCAAIHATSNTNTGYDQRGCLAIPRAGARWVYENTPLESTVIIFE